MFTLDIKADRLTARLTALEDALDDMSPVMADLGEFFVTSTKDRFTEGKGPDGIPWAPKSETTKAAYRARKDPVSDNPLWGPSGRLRTEIFAQAGPNSIEWGSNLVYAGVHQFGAQQGQFGAWIGKDKIGRDHFHSIPWGDIPARPYLGISPEDELSAIDIIEEWLAGIGD